MSKQVSLLLGGRPRCEAIRETRYANDHNDENRCSRVARYKIGPLKFCTQHAKDMALCILIEAGRTP